MPVPHLNEECYKAILDVIIRRKQADLATIKQKYAGMNCIPQLNRDLPNTWHDLLQTNRDRLVFHGQVPLLKNAIICVSALHNAQHLMGEYPKIMKDVGQIAVWVNPFSQETGQELLFFKFEPAWASWRLQAKRD